MIEKKDFRKREREKVRKTGDRQVWWTETGSTEIEAQKSIKVFFQHNREIQRR